MSTKYKAIKISETGVVTTGSTGEPIMCPLSDKRCHVRCAWYSNDGTVSRCQDTIIGIIEGQKLVRSFRLKT